MDEQYRMSLSAVLCLLNVNRGILEVAIHSSNQRAMLRFLSRIVYDTRWPEYVSSMQYTMKN